MRGHEFLDYRRGYLSISLCSIRKGLSNRARGQSSLSTPRNNYKTPLMRIFIIVAGARFERAYPGYEPGELPLLYPAIIDITTKVRRKQLGEEAKVFASARLIELFCERSA